MADKCPDCGVPLDEIPCKECGGHRSYEPDKREALRLMFSGRSWAQKIAGSEDFEEMQEHLVAYFRSIE